MGRFFIPEATPSFST